MNLLGQSVTERPVELPLVLASWEFAPMPLTAVLVIVVGVVIVVALLCSAERA